MAQMALGYGSEFQLMRFLGHHRNYLNKLIRETVDAGENTTVEWLDYPYNRGNRSGDGEWKGIECFNRKELDFGRIETEWKKYWPQSGNSMNWDGIFRMGDTWYFVEAKANKTEAYQKCGAIGKTSIEKIDKAFEKTKEWLGIKGNIEWRKTECYQLANRLAFIHFCHKMDISAKLLYISFCNDKNGKISSQNEWGKIWKEEYEALGIDENLLKSKLYHIYPDCKNTK